MSAIQTFWITAGLIAVAAAMYRMGTIVEAGRKAAEENAARIERLADEFGAFKADVAAAFKDCDASIRAYDRRLGSAEDRYSAISKLIEQQSQMRHVLEAQVAVCAERHHESLRLELDARDIEGEAIPRKRS